MSKSKKFVYKEGITKKHEVLKEAMKYLSPTYTLESDGEYDLLNPFICHCISRVTLEENWNKPKDKTGLHTVIKTRLQGHYTLEDWLWDKHGITQAETCSNAGVNSRQQEKHGCKACTKSSFLKMNKDKL